jgi:hypothetical protein
MGYKRGRWQKEVWAMLEAVEQVGGCRSCLGGTLNDKTSKSYGISSLGGGSFNNHGARAINSIGTLWPSGPGVMTQNFLGSK